MNRILLIVEGKKREKNFFERYKKVKKLSDNLEIVPFCQNIKELFRLSKEYIFNGIKPNNLLDILKDSNISYEDAQKLDNLFTDIYLIFDLDIQNAQKEENVINYLNDVKELINFFDDSTSIGQVLINYPSMDSIYNLTDDQSSCYRDIKISSALEDNEKYKSTIDSMQLPFDCQKLTQNDFNMLAAINLKKANYVVKNNYNKVDSATYEYELTQNKIFDKQKENITHNSFMHVLNTSLFIDVDLFGKTLYFHGRGERLFIDEVLLDSLSHK